MNILEEFRQLTLAVQRETGRMLGEALRPLGLTPAQAEVLEVLLASQPVSLGELGARLLCETGSPSRLVERLIGAGLVERRPSRADRRAVELRLTPAGEERAFLAREMAREFSAELGGLLAGAPLEEINRHLWRVVTHLPSGRALRWKVARGGGAE